MKRAALLAALALCACTTKAEREVYPKVVVAANAELATVPGLAGDQILRGVTGQGDSWVVHYRSRGWRGAQTSIRVDKRTLKVTWISVMTGGPM